MLGSNSRSISVFVYILAALRLHRESPRDAWYILCQRIQRAVVHKAELRRYMSTTHASTIGILISTHPEPGTQ